MNENIQHGILGQTTDYPKTYAPNILYPIPRSLGRQSLALPTEQLSIGMDWWQVFELSWLNPLGVSQVAMARLDIPASSEFIVESKSLKLYFNSLNFTEFDSVTKVQNTVETDLSNLLKTNVEMQIFDVKDVQSLAISEPQGDCIDNSLDEYLKRRNIKFDLTKDIDSKHLTLSSPKAESDQFQIYHSHLLRSNCPVTNQPDWGTVEIQIDCPLIDTAGLLKYILTFRQHNGFHEQCVEQIFSDLMVKFHPSKLLVRAWYTRRGGVDINPCRVSDVSLLPSPSRLNRQ